jgi:hypothetical protein
MYIKKNPSEYQREFKTNILCMIINESLITKII